MKRNLVSLALVVVGLLALAPTAAVAECDTCRQAIVCNPNCDLIEYCAPARGLLGGLCYEDYFFGCYVTEPCKLVDATPFRYPARLLRPAPTGFFGTSACS